MMKQWLIRRSGPDPVLARDHSVHHLVGVETALHQRLNPARVYEGDSLGRGIVAVRRGDEFEPADVEVEPRWLHSEPLRRPDQDRLDQAELLGFNCAAK